VADSSSYSDDTTESKSESKSAQTTEDRPDEPLNRSHQPVTVYRQDEVTPRHREQPETSSQRHHDDVVDDDKPKHKPRSEAPAVSTVETKAPREKLTLEQLQSRLPDRSDGSRNVRPGLVWCDCIAAFSLSLSVFLPYYFYVFYCSMGPVPEIKID